MKRMKVPLGWPVWGWFTLLASLGVHGYLLSLPISLDLDAPDPEPETLAAIPLATLPEIAPPSPEPEMTAADPELEYTAADNETEDLEYVETVAREIDDRIDEPEPEPEAREQPSETTPPRRQEEFKTYRTEEVAASEPSASYIRPKKRILNAQQSPEHSNEVGENASSSTEELEQSLKTALDTIYSDISARLSSSAEDEGQPGVLGDNPKWISDTLWMYDLQLLWNGPPIEQLFDGDTPKEGVIQVALVQNPENKEDEIEIQKLYEDFVAPPLSNQGFDLTPISTQEGKKLYEAHKESLERRVLLVSLPHLNESSDPENSKNYGTFIMVYDPGVLVDIDL